MKTLYRTTTDSVRFPKGFDFYFKGMSLGVLDIETTGLDPRQSIFVLGGLLISAGTEIKETQIFAETPAEEGKALCAFLAEITKADFLMSYNGQKFDLPFLRERSKGACPAFPFHLDLYQVLHRYSPLRQFLPNLRQKTVESFFGLWEHRTDEISGQESVELYHQYVANGDPALAETILLHNRDDIRQLHKLVIALEKSDFHRAMYHMGFPVARPRQLGGFFVVERIAFSDKCLSLSGRQQGKGWNYQSYEFPFTALFDGRTGSFQISVPTVCRGGLVLVDLRRMGLDTAPFEKYPTCGDGFLVLEKAGRKNYLEINHVVKEILERMTNQWITRK